jgi:hypothetical protein
MFYGWPVFPFGEFNEFSFDGESPNNMGKAIVGVVKWALFIPGKKINTMAETRIGYLNSINHNSNVII